MKKLTTAIDRFCLTHPRFGVPGLMRYVVVLTSAVFLLDWFSGGAATHMLYGSLSLIRLGEVWRLLTWLVIPESSNAFWFVVEMMFYYFIGSAIESRWGTARFTLFYLSGAALTVLFGCLSALWTPYACIIGSYLNTLLFLAFATLFPDATLRLYFVLPVKAKWLAALYVGMMAYNIVHAAVSTPFLLPVMLSMMAASWLAYFLFFWDGICAALARAGLLERRQRSHKTIQFKEAAKRQEEKARRQGYRHKCCVCGRTDADSPELSFRYCSRCAGYHCFCEKHIFNHAHFTE